MKTNFIRISALLGFTILVATGFSEGKKVDLSAYKMVDEGICYNVPSEAEVQYFAKPLAPAYQLFLGKTYVGFKEALGFKESRGDYWTVNQFGYLGKYQFASATLRMIGINNPELFMENTQLQEAAFTAYTSRNKWILRRDIKRYKGKTINGVKVTESGILAAAHLAGAGNVKKYLRSGGTVGFNDAFGTSIRYYIKKFSGYDVSHVKPNKRARVRSK